MVCIHHLLGDIDLFLYVSYKNISKISELTCCDLRETHGFRFQKQVQRNFESGTGVTYWNEPARKQVYSK